MKIKAKPSVKDKMKSVKDKMQAAKAKIKDKLKGPVKATVSVVVLCAALCGCMDTAPASRYTAGTVGDITVKNNVDDMRNRPGPWATNAVSAVAPSVPLVSISTVIKLGDLAMASADSEGSTETQTATPTLDVRTRVDARYNDAISGATTASQKVLGAIGDGITGVLDLMDSKKTGEVKVTKTDGSAATVRCENGQCSFVDSSAGGAL